MPPWRLSFVPSPYSLIPVSPPLSASHCVSAGCVQSLLRPQSRVSWSRLSDPVLRAFPDTVLRDAIFQRMKTYDNEPCGGPKQRWCSLKQCPDFVQFAVNEDSQCLKCSGSRVNMFHWRDGRSYDPGQLHRGCNRPPSHNGSGDCPRPPFLTVFVNEIRQLALARLIHHLFGRGLGSRIHSHIQRPVRLKTKPSSRLIELQAAHAEVGQQAIGRSRRYVRGDAAERFADETHLRRLAAELLGKPSRAGPWPTQAPRDRAQSRSGVPPIPVA